MRKVPMLGLGVYNTEDTEDIIEIEDFGSQRTMLDYSSALISVQGIEYDYVNNPGTFKGLKCISDDNQSAKLVRDMKRRKNEVVELLNQGNNIFVILPSEQNIYIRTGEKEYSGTGRNMKTTNIVGSYDLLSFLPVEIKCTNATGCKITYVGNGCFDIIKENILDNLEYKSYISKVEGTSILQIANTSKSVGLVIEYGKGKIILLPDIAGEELYKNEVEWDEGISKYLRTIVQLDADLKCGSNEYELPEWTKFYLIPQEKEELDKLDDYVQQINSLNEKIRIQKKVIRELQKIKIAFASTGAVLENICKEMFVNLGFKELEKGHNRSDLVLRYGRKDIVVEIKGLNKSAGEKKAAQLEKWVSEHIEHFEKQPKAILLVNAFRNIRLDERKEEVFPNQMLKYASSREQCLISTTQFICLYLDCIENPTKKKDIIKKMLDTVGIYEEYEDISRFIKKVELES